MQKVLAVAIAVAALAHAQKNEVSLLAGGVIARHKVVADIGAVLKSTAASPNIQASYARQVRDGRTSLAIEAPVVIAVRKVGNGRLGGGTSGPDLYFTPGLRVEHSLWRRVSIHGSVGAGVASFTPEYSIYVPYVGALQPGGSGLSGGILQPVLFPPILGVGVIAFAPENRANSAALGIGGGVSYRLTPHFGLRAEARNFITKVGLGGATGRNHSAFQGGLVFRF